MGQSSPLTTVSLFVHITECSNILTEHNFKDVYDFLYTVREKWRVLGIKLGLERSDLNNFESEYTGNDRRLEEVVSLWLKTRSLQPTWKSLIDALKSNTVKEEGLAHDVEKIFEKTRGDAVIENSVISAMDSLHTNGKLGLLHVHRM